ncbi:MAG: hypothetical protein O7F69_03540 [Alphaproteobacteria bacterium]|nr:hypothetical protein [Alphaproteobacteria bacterium]MCZ6592278.1 hypothetical protein [Alphaproteobacteria bacterium]MCZ6844951.1 hypothetical protein [Alphaproteobacteria bacterium]
MPTQKSEGRIVQSAPVRGALSASGTLMWFSALALLPVGEAVAARRKPAMSVP